jgi:hypothetical protein
MTQLMAQTSWLERLNQIFVTVAIVAVGSYGTWDLIIRPWAKEAPQVALCTPTITRLALDLPGKGGKSGKAIAARSDLPVIVPAGEQRGVSVQVENPDDKGVTYNWRATYGTFDSSVTTDGRAIYRAPNSLVDDTITVEVRMQGCSLVTQTAAIAVVPSATAPSQPLSDPDPIPPAPANPSSSLPGGRN